MVTKWAAPVNCQWDLGLGTLKLQQRCGRLWPISYRCKFSHITRCNGQANGVLFDLTAAHCQQWE